MTAMIVLVGLGLIPLGSPATLAMFLPVIGIAVALAVWIYTYYARMYGELRERAS